MRFDGSVEDFTEALRAEERSRGTVEKYARDVRRFLADTEGGEFSREAVADWRDGLAERGYATATVNSMVSAVNRFLEFAGRGDCRVKLLRVQRRVFRDRERELTREDYRKLVESAPERTALLMETICATGIRVSEARYITVEAARAGRAEIRLKGKVRTILIPGKLCRKLIKYAKKAENRLRRDLSHRKRRVADAKADLEPDEGGVRKSRR